MIGNLSYAGVPLGMPAENIEKRLSKFFPVDQLRDIQQPDSQPWPNLRKAAFARPPEEPSATLNQFFYPSGASRWGVFRGLVNQSGLNQIISQAYPGNVATACPFIMNTDPTYQNYLTTNLYLLPARPISPTSKTQQAEYLYLITLVDDRYFFQWRPAQKVTCGGQWTDLINQLTGWLGITLTISPAIEAAYGTPNPDSALYSNYESAAQLLDAVAYNLGRVVVRNLDGTYALIKWAQANTNATNGDSSAAYRTAGGLILDSMNNKEPAKSAILPATVVVTYPKQVESGACQRFYDPSGRLWYTMGGESYPDVYASSVTVSTLGSPYSSYGNNGGTKVLHNTAAALYSSDTLAGSGTPVNQSTLDSLSQQLTKDYVDMQLATLDVVYPGIMLADPLWSPCDVIWTYREGDSIVESLGLADVSCTTRVQRKPFNFGYLELQHNMGEGSGSGTGSGNGCCVSKIGGMSIVDLPGYIPGEEMVLGISADIPPCVILIPISQCVGGGS